MNKFTKFLSIYLLPVLGLIFYSCIDDPVYPDGNIVNVSLHDFYGEKHRFNINLERYFVSPGDAPITILTQSEFIFNTYQSPYDMVITSDNTPYIFKYTGITSKNIKPLYYDYESAHFTRLDIRIRIPEIKVESTVYFVNFISDFNYLQEANRFTMRTGDSIMYCYLQVPEHIHSTYISGKIIIFEAENWGNKENINYKRFGYKESDSLNGASTIVFTESDLEYDLPDILTSFSNTPPAGRNGNSLVSISFPGYSKSADLVLIGGTTGNFDFIIPALPLDNNVRFTGTYDGGNYLDKAFKSELFELGDNCVITHKEPISLVSPAYGDSNVTGSTIFKIYDDQPGGVYLYEFNISGAHRPLRIYTERKELKFSEILTREFEWRPNSQYIWFARKFPGFANVDELLSTPYTLSSKYNATQSTEPRYFYTGP